MKSLTMSLAILASSMALATLGLGAAADQTQKIKQLTVRSAADIGKAFGAATNDGGREPIVITCFPAGSEWCAKGFVAACDKHKGGLGSDDQGGVTCSLPQYN